MAERKSRICITPPKDIMEKIDNERTSQYDGLSLERATWVMQLIFDHFKEKKKKKDNKEEFRFPTT